MISTPKPPDPYKTAQAQSQWNQTTAQTQQALNMVNQVGPEGSLTYNQNGTQTIIGADGKPIKVPQYTATTSLSPQQQAIFNQTQKAQGNLAGLAADQSAEMREYLKGGLDLSGVPDLASGYAGADDFAANRDEVEAALWQRGAGDRAGQQEALRTQLMNSGIREGSAAWNAEMERMGRQNTDARLATMLAGGQEQSRLVGMSRDAASFQNAARGQGMSEAFAQRAQPINELSALMSGSQVGMPQFQTTPQTGVAGVDYTGLVNQQYQAELANSQSMMGGLFGLAGTGLSLFSDRRAKRDVERIGTTANGLPWYEFNYIWDAEDEPRREGLMSDDVRQMVPSAVHVDDVTGFDKVDYRKALEAA